MGKKLVVASSNKNKLREIRYILGDLDLEILSKDDIGLEDLEVVEDQDSLMGNSLKKAREISQRCSHMVMADDSGLFVDYLDGRPGVYSARYAGEDHDDERNNNKLLGELAGLDMDKRGARFIAVICLIDQEGQVYQIEGQCEGHILQEARGTRGFGYDPIFRPLGYEESFGQLDDSIKNKISHRYRALEGLREELVKIIGD